MKALSIAWTVTYTVLSAISLIFTTFSLVGSLTNADDQVGDCGCDQDGDLLVPILFIIITLFVIFLVFKGIKKGIKKILSYFRKDN